MPALLHDLSPCNTHSFWCLLLPHLGWELPIHVSLLLLNKQGLDEGSPKPPPAWMVWVLCMGVCAGWPSSQGNGP